MQNLWLHTTKRRNAHNETNIRLGEKPNERLGETHTKTQKQISKSKMPRLRK